MGGPGLAWVLATLSGCGGSGGGADAGGGPTAGSNPSPLTPPGGATVLFQQPQEPGIGGHFYVPHAPGGTVPPSGAFSLIYWQLNPNSPNGQLVPTAWNAGSYTGFTPSSPVSQAQLGFQDRPGTSTAQMEGGTVGAYITSQDLPGSPIGQKMMITPQYDFVAGSQSVPFATSTSILSSTLNLQVPLASGDDTYINADFQFTGPNGVRVSFDVKLFSNGVTDPLLGTGYDAPSFSYYIEPPLGTDQQFVTMGSGSSPTASEAWVGWRAFSWTISQNQFTTALGSLSSKYPGALSTDPSQYVLTQIHLNAEFHFQPEAADLGWSMSAWTVWTT